MDDTKINDIVEAVVRQLIAAGAVSGIQSSVSSVLAKPSLPEAPAPKANFDGSSQANTRQSLQPTAGSNLVIDLPDPSSPELRTKAG
ncbi:MAG: hypothetical protein WCK35_20705, partial [Chloroflexota bacterium]